MSTANVTRRLRIHGRVQGVGYRNYIEFKAGELGVSGWVRNRLDGSVEAVVHGTPAAVAAIIEYAQRGPRAAAVTAVTVDTEEGLHSSFRVLPTA